MTQPDSSPLRTSGMVAGVPVFTGTRVPLQSIVPYLCAERGIEEFLRDHPAVTREQVYVTLCFGIDALVERHERLAELAAGGRASRIADEPGEQRAADRRG